MALPSARDPEETRATLTDWFAANVPGARGLVVGELSGPPSSGFSNETIICPVRFSRNGQSEEHRYVVRVRPTSHALFPDDLFEVQVRVIRALGRLSDLRVPTIHWYEDDASVLGAAFMVMDAIAGRAPQDSPPYTMEGWYHDAPPATQRAVWDRGLEAMARIHSVDWRALELAELDPCPHGGNRFEARLGYWSDMLSWSSPEAPQPVPDAARIWLEANLPDDDQPAALCWGDSRIGNQLFAGEGTAVDVVGVLDWEMVHVGDPVQDLAWFSWLDKTLSAGLDQPRLAGLPSYDDTIARWEQLTGRLAVHHQWAEILGGFAFAVIMVRLSQLLVDVEVFPVDNDFARTNMAAVQLERALEAAAVP